MKIKRDSWHYRLFASWWDERPASLCTYFWKVVWTAVVMLGITGFLGCIALAPILSWFALLPAPMLVISFIVWMVVGWAILYTHRQWLYESGKLERPRRKYKEPGLISQFVSAQHRKVCPFVEYE